MIIAGTKAKETVIGTGDFKCPVCFSQTSYVRKRFDQYFTLFFIPLFKLGTLGEHTECLSCHSIIQDKSQHVIEEPEKMWECPNCKAQNPNTTYTCQNCHYSLV